MQDGTLFQAPLIDLANAPRLIRPFKESEQKLIESAMILCRGNLMLAARHLEIGRATLYRKLAKYKQVEES